MTTARIKDGLVDARIGSYVKKRREEKDITRTELAKKLGYSWPNFISMLENGAAKFPIEKWFQYADGLSTPRNEFLKLVIEVHFPEMLDHLIFVENRTQKEQFLKKLESAK